MTLLDQIKKSNKFDSGVSNFARIPLTKFTMKDDVTENINNEEIESVTFSPDAVTISGTDNLRYYLNTLSQIEIYPAT